MFKGKTLSRALKATFKRRKTPFPTRTPLALTEELHQDGTKQTPWRAFLKKNRLDAKDNDLAQVVGLLKEFLLAPALAAANDEPSDAAWAKGGPWISRSS